MNNIIARYGYQILVIFFLIPFAGFGQNAKNYYQLIKEKGIEPIKFVSQQLEKYDLIIFDDALHLAAEPFDFYQEFLKNYKNGLDYVFLEVFGISSQPYLDAYLDSPAKDSTLLLKVFQDNFSGLGWRYETYCDLLSTIWDINHHLIEKDSKKIRVVGVDQPIYWEGIHTREEYDIFQKSLVGRDYFMYKTILGYMNNFKEDKKGIFLTNTRHAYKHIKNANGQTYWNCGTFFNQWHDQKTYSIRIHNVSLSIEALKTDGQGKSVEGLDRIEYKWIQMEDGLWDEAFKLNDNAPVAFSLKNNIFGQAKYVGNHMLNVAEDQTIYDAYDALIFLAPLDNLHFSPQIDFIYTEPFKKELRRRLNIIYENEIEDFLKTNKVSSIEEYIDQMSQYVPKSKNNFLTGE